MGSKWTVQDVKKVLMEAGEVMGLSPADISVQVSSRMERTMGSFLFKEKAGVITPFAFRFSEVLLSGKFENQVVRDVILHEYAHFYANVKSQKNHNHDDYFKSICIKLGTPPHTYFKELLPPQKKRGYVLVCRKCGKTVAKRRRIDAVEKIMRTKISTCCRAKLGSYQSIF